MSNPITDLTAALAAFNGATNHALAAGDLAGAVAQFLGAFQVPNTVHLVGIAGHLASTYDMDDQGSEQRVMLAFADATDAEQWATLHNATVPWSPTTKVESLGEVTFVPSGASAPAPQN